MDASVHILIMLASVPIVIGSTHNATYIGCFQTPTTALPESTIIIILYDVHYCIEHCYDGGYQYAALYKRDNIQCGCGRDIPLVSDNLDDFYCSSRCPGNHSLTCGSYGFKSVYEIHGYLTVIDVDLMEGFLYGFGSMGESGSVGFINLTSPEETQNILTVPEKVKQVDFHWKKRMLFASTPLRKYSSDLGGNSSAKPVAGVPSNSCEAFAVDWVHDKLLWADCYERVTIKSSDLDGANPVTLVTRNVDAPITRMEVDPIHGTLFWMFGKTIESCSLDGTNLQINISRTSSSLRGLALDLSSKRLFFVCNNGSAVLYSIGYAGGNQLTAHWASEQMRSVYGLSVFKGIVYWTNYEGRDVIFEARLNDSSSTRMITRVTKSVWHIRLVHPDLQPQLQSSRDPCDILQCSFRCDAGHCVCLQGSHLAPDLRTCRDDNESLVNVTFVGCFGAVSGSLIGESTFNIANTTLGKCVDQCRAQNTRYVAIDISSRVCHCGPDIPYESQKFSDTMCDAVCPDDAAASCGGDGVHSVYDVIDANTTVYKDGADMLVGTSDSVLIFNTSRKFEYGTVRKSKSHIDNVDYHWEKKLVFSIDTTGKMFKSPLNWTNGNQTNDSSVQIHNMTQCDGFAVDWVHDRIFWAYCDSDAYDYDEEPNNVVSIRTINLDGTDEKTLVTRNTDIMVKRMVLDPYAGKLFWISGGMNVETCDMDGNNVDTVYRNNASDVRRHASGVREIFLDLPSRRIFYVAKTDRLTLSSMDYAGSDRKDHWNNVDELRYVYGLGVVNGVVYWVNWLVLVSDVLYQAPLSDPSKLEVVRSLSGVWHMRVVHPSLQSDPCAVPDCKKQCDQPQSTDCQCPKHCSTKIVSEPLEVAPVVESVFLGALLLAAIVSAAALLLYFSDKYWSLIRSRITRTSVPSYRQSRDSFPDGAVSEDNLNLVDD